jgi:hypothetical protein
MSESKFKEWGRRFSIFLIDFLDAAAILALGYAFAITVIGLFFTLLWGTAELIKLMFY